MNVLINTFAIGRVSTITSYTNFTLLFSLNLQKEAVRNTLLIQNTIAT